MPTVDAEISVLARPAGVEWPPSRAVDIETPLSDHELMLAVRDGDLDSMGELFERHHGPLFGYLTKLTGDRTAAEDISQVVFQRMLKYRHTYRNEGKFTAWMYHLGRRCASDYFRKASSDPLPVDPSGLSEQADEAQSADESAAASDDRALLRRALNRLDRDDREVLLLSRFQELSFEEVAGILECSVGAARVRAHRALRTLRGHYFRLQKENPL
jgi:RNA polymerase sigma factor (sigma-70 family)